MNPVRPVDVCGWEWTPCLKRMTVWMQTCPLSRKGDSRRSAPVMR